MEFLLIIKIYPRVESKLLIIVIKSCNLVHVQEIQHYYAYNYIRYINKAIYIIILRIN